ncbi:MAG: DUF2628 domain-containing protein [Neisseria animaloris]|nr:DUF2628 domain-containing protein [Neisseria animaloris]
MNANDYSGLSGKWQKRFEFFDKYGTNPNVLEFKAAIKAVPFMQRNLYLINFIAFFFGFIYFFVLGLWRKNLTLLGITVACSILLDAAIMLFAPDITEHSLNAINRGVGFAFAALYALTANRAYYLHKVKGSKSWNPFEQ